VLHTIKSEKAEYIILEFTEGELGDPDSDPLLIGVARKDIGPQPVYIPCAIWRNTLWRIVDNSAISIIAALAGIDVPSADIPTRIRELEDKAKQLTEDANRI